MNSVDAALATLERAGNLRHLPSELPSGVLDLSQNDYLGLAGRTDLQQRFLAQMSADDAVLLTSSASRLLASHQSPYRRLEAWLAGAYGREALLFNSGYHANTGIVQALASLGGVRFLADKLVHASVIDGLRLDGAPFDRFRHNDTAHLARLLQRSTESLIVVIVESIYSMDGDSADIDALIDLRRTDPRVMLYVDEAHALGVTGPSGLGRVMASKAPAEVDIIVGTFGKALASQGAFAAVSAPLKQYLINKARSLIFSTALPPLSALWSLEMLRRMTSMDAERAHLRVLADILGADSHIAPFMVGDARRAVELSGRLRDRGFLVLPIRTPTVPPGTERLRVSLSAAMSADDIKRFRNTLADEMR